MGKLSEDQMYSLYETLDSLREICEHRNVELKDVIALYQACAMDRGVRAAYELSMMIDDLVLENLCDKDTVGGEK